MSNNIPITVNQLKEYKNKDSLTDITLLINNQEELNSLAEDLIPTSVSILSISAKYPICLLSNHFIKSNIKTLILNQVSLESAVIPSGVENIVFNGPVEFKFGNGFFPDSVRSIKFTGYIKHRFESRDVFPANLETLEIGRQSTFNIDALPSSLTTLIGCPYYPNLKEKIPNCKVLHLSSCPNPSVSITRDDIPLSVVDCRMNGEVMTKLGFEDNSNILTAFSNQLPTEIPSNIKSIKLFGVSDLSKINIPSTVESLSVQFYNPQSNDCNNAPFIGVPSTIKEYRVVCFQNINFETAPKLPTSIESFTLSSELIHHERIQMTLEQASQKPIVRGNQIPKGFLHEGLKTLITNHPVDYCDLPSTITSLYLGLANVKDAKDIYPFNKFHLTPLYKNLIELGFDLSYVNNFKFASDLVFPKLEVLTIPKNTLNINTIKNQFPQLKVLNLITFPQDRTVYDQDFDDRILANREFFRINEIKPNYYTKL